MSNRFPYRLGLAIVAVAGLIALTGCEFGRKDAADPAPGAAGSAQPTPSTGGSAAGTRSPAARAGLPDVCELLSKAEVSSLAGGRNVVSIDPDGATAEDSTRHCQWQISGARLAVFLSPTTASEFTRARGQSPAVSGVGDDAYTDSGHLFVRHDTIQVDVYATIGSDTSAGDRMAKATALKVIERL